MTSRTPLAVATAFFMAVAAVPVATLAQGALERVEEAGYLRVGFPNQTPYAYATVDGTLTGADAEVAREVVTRMGLGEMVGVLTEFAGLIPGLKARG